ncbi:MAG: alpha/beta fold hydrolase [Bacteroidota bacterium]
MKESSVNIFLQDKATVSLTIYEATGQKEQVIFLLLPAMGVKASYYQPFLTALASTNNRIVASVDLRGLGTSSVRPSADMDFGYLHFINDLKTVIQFLKNKYPRRKIVVIGHSLGGQIAILGQAKFRNLLDGLVLIAANSVYYKGWSGKQRYVNLLGYTLFPILSRIVGYFPGHKVGFGGKAAKTQLYDWAYVGRNGVYKISGDSLDYEKALKNTQLPILAIDIEGDWMSPPKAMAYLYGKLHAKSPIERFTLTTQATGGQLNHFNWTKHSQPLVEMINRWSDRP